MPNHAAVFIDPAMITMALWPKYPLRPLVVDYMYHTPVVNTVMKQLDAIPIPDFDVTSNVLKKRESDQALEKLIQGVKDGDNFLIYPAARTKSSAKEIVGGSSGVYNILQKSQEANVVLVRIAGLWGSSFSRAYTGYAPPLTSLIWDGIKTAFKNGLFFTPKRDVHIAFEPAPADFPFNGSKRELNTYLEKWYNRPDGLVKQEEEYPGDSLIKVSYSRWSPVFKEPVAVKSGLESEVKLDQVPEKVKNKVYRWIAEVASRDPSTITDDLHLHQDLGLDSLDTAELAAFLHDEFKVPMAPVMELNTVKLALGIASKQIHLEVEAEEIKSNLSEWEKPRERHRVQIADGATIPEVFLNNCERMGKAAAVVDRASGVVSYDKLKLRILALVSYIKNLPGEHIGIMLPASVAAYASIIAVQMAGKVPVMLNCTIGKRHLDSVVSISKLEVILSSWKFFDRLGNIDIEGHEDKFLMLEDVRDSIGLGSKLKALYLSKQSPKKVMEKLGIKSLSKDDRAVILFTSGTESMPKGVPLTHNNLLANQRGTLASIPIFSDDIILGILPPFHSFGFSISGLLALLAGIRIGFSPNPLEGVKVARDFAEWSVSVMIGAPTFTKNLLNAATAEMLKTMRICVSGAEAAPPELFKELEEIGKGGAICEGYGITECGPVLTANRPELEPKGVGQPIEGVEVIIVHQETNEPVPTGTSGMILARGPNVFSGYLNPGLDSPFTKVNGVDWYITGDLGFFDEEGRLTISGRQKRFVKIGGEMVSLQALESAVLEQMHDGHADSPLVAVCAKEIPGEKTKLHLFSVKEMSVDEANQIVQKAGFSNLVRFHDVQQVEDIPIMGTGKIAYRLLDERL